MGWRIKQPTSLIVAVVSTALVSHFLSNAVFAGIEKNTHENSSGEIELLRKRIEQLESLQTLQTLHEDSFVNNAVKIIAVSCTVEVDASSITDYADNVSSDIVLATAALLFEASISDGINAQLALLHEEDDTALEVDEAYITLGYDLGFVNAGLFYMPFGSFVSNLVSDPLTLEIGEIRESAIEVGVNVGSVVASAYFFNGDIDDNKGQDKAQTEMYGMSFAFVGGNDSVNYELGAGYISSIVDTDTLQGVVSTVDDYVDGISVDAAIVMTMDNTSSVNVYVEYTAALNEFTVDELIFDNEGAQPAAFNVEVGYLMGIDDFETQFAVSYQGTKEASALALPEERIAIAASTLIADNTTLGIELSRDIDYEVGDGGSGESANMIVAQLAVVF